MGDQDFEVDEIESLWDIDDTDDSTFYACKIAERIKLNKYLEKQINKECLNQSSISNDYVVRLNDAIKTDNRYYIMIEYCNGGTLEDICEAQDYKVSGAVIHKCMV